GGIAHDFNNLLGVILNYASLLARDAESDDVRADLAEISAAAERGAGLTRQLLTFARRDAGRRESVEVNTVVRDVTTMLRRTLGELVELELLLHPQPLHVLADRHQLEQIVLNLAINARDAMPDGGTLVITTRPGPEPPQPGSLGTVELSVVDSGTGMSPDVVERAVEPFFTTKPPGQGTGLGLATVYGIAGQHGGELALESALGAGTTVTVRLPAAQAPTALLPEAGGAEQAGRGERVLLVEDESALRVGTARLLERHGYAVTTAVDGEEAWSMLTASQDYDVVLTDIVMPRLKGSQLARRLRDTGSEIPVVFMSGYDSGDTSAIPGPVLVKPVEERELLATLRSVLDPEIS
ncbi:MAG TPA: ATP-binding protein, partial [Candidatus Nanopelagicales bacterium]|nr:ATP-binding protein [Candidatus Nanopelagicales bacterium]